jgi:hypothetical protein
VYRGLKKHIAIGILLYLLFSIVVPTATAEIETRQELRSGDLLVNMETILIPPALSTLFHTQTAASTDSEALAISPLQGTAGTGFSLAQTCDETSTAAETGFFRVEFVPYFLRYDQLPGYIVGDTPAWVDRMGPISFAGLPADTTMIFPDMTLVTRRINQSMPEINQTASGNRTAGSVNNSTNVSQAARYDYILDANNSRPYLPGNVMQVKTIKNEKGENETVIDRAPQRYRQLYATPAEIANKTIIDRMWRNVHLNFNMDRAYSGETCYPDIICPLKNPFTLMPWLNTGLTVIDALNMTQPGTHLKKVMWPV